MKLDIMVVPNHTGQQSMFKGHIYDGRSFQYICDQVYIYKILTFSLTNPVVLSCLSHGPCL